MIAEGTIPRHASGGRTMTGAVLAATDSAVGPALAIIVCAGMVAQWLAWRAQLPSIIALLVTGLVLGPVLGVVDPDELLGDTLFPIVSLSVALILFEGGLDLPPRELRNTGTVVRRLITVGAAVAFGIGWISARELFGISNQASIVLAAVLVVTGPTVVGPLLRFVRPAGKAGPILRAEGVLIDPIGATAALIAFEVVLVDAPDQALLRVLGIVLLTIVGGAGIGLGAAMALDVALRRFLIPDQLAVPITLAFVIGGFVIANEVQEEAGLLAVTVLGIYLARRDSSTIRKVLEFNESLRTVLISALFILLAARIQPQQLSDVLVPSLAFLAVLVLVARPLSVIASTVRTSLPWRERLFLMAMAPRGIVAAAVSAIFALRLEEEQIPDADAIVPIVFLVIIGTITVYGLLAGPAARRLGLAESHADGVLVAGANSVARGLATTLREHDIKATLVDTDAYSVARAVAGGSPARRMNVLSDDAVTDLDLRGIGRLLALTSNDEVNALAAERYSRVFGRREVYQLAPTTRPGGTTVPAEYLGRILGIAPITYEQLDERSRQGWRVISIPVRPTVTEAFEDGQLIAMMRIVEGRLAILCRDDPLPTTGHVIGLASPALRRSIIETDQ